MREEHCTPDVLREDTITSGIERDEGAANYLTSYVSGSMDYKM